LFLKLLSRQRNFWLPFAPVGGSISLMARFQGSGSQIDLIRPKLKDKVKHHRRHQVHPLGPEVVSGDDIDYTARCLCQEFVQRSRIQIIWSGYAPQQNYQPTGIFPQQQAIHAGRSLRARRMPAVAPLRNATNSESKQNKPLSKSNDTKSKSPVPLKATPSKLMLSTPTEQGAAKNSAAAKAASKTNACFGSRRWRPDLTFRQNSLIPDFDKPLPPRPTIPTNAPSQFLTQPPAMAPPVMQRSAPPMMSGMPARKKQCKVARSHLVDEKRIAKLEQTAFGAVYPRARGRKIA